MHVIFFVAHCTVCAWTRKDERIGAELEQLVWHQLVFLHHPRILNPLFFFRNTSSYLSKKTVDDLRHGEQRAVKSGTWQRLDVSLCSIDGDPLPRWRLFSSRPHEFCALCRH